MQVLQVSVSTLRAAARPLTGGGARGQLGAGQRAVSPGPWTRLVRPHRYHTYTGEIQAERSHFYKTIMTTSRMKAKVLNISTTHLTDKQYPVYK